MTYIKPKGCSQQSPQHPVTSCSQPPPKNKSTPQTTHHNPPTVPSLQMSRNQKPKSLAGEYAHRTMEHNEPYYATNELPVLTFRLFQMATRAPQGGKGVGRGPPIEFSYPVYAYAFMLLYLLEATGTF
ncbi:hypothetical protein CEXT_485951 [Caerostris extrusa]|uniref:Uncharacterized protein n=1 Tax=Caerostris extrusa TaxID=172846 RepID=A0AAV4THM5_CAEEX|nr:hypothetical protein CEXT_485951 [Caerostris extrusa]